MYEVRCQNCNKKIAEIARKPVFDFIFSTICRCGKELNGKTCIDEENQIIVFLRCSCGYENVKIVSHIVAVKCKRCKTITKF